MRRRFTAVVLTIFLFAGHSSAALAATRVSSARAQAVPTFVVKAVKYLKEIFKITTQDDVDTPIPPRPCTTNCP